MGTNTASNVPANIEDNNTSTTSSSKVLEAWMNPLSSNLSAYDVKNHKTLILRTDTFVLDSQVKFATDALYIYAETVLLKANVSFPGKTIGIFCNQLQVARVVPADKGSTGAAAEDKVSTGAIISVAGDDGETSTLNTATSAKNNGGDAGKIILSIEKYDKSLLPVDEDHGLTLNAAGGNGGTGASSDSGNGNAGGNGGNGGSIQFYFGYPALEKQSALERLLAEKRIWWSKAKDLAALNFTGITDSKSAFPAFKKAASDHVACYQSLSSISNILPQLTTTGASDPKAMLDQKLALITSVKSALDWKDQPALGEKTLEDLGAAFTKFQTHFKSTTEATAKDAIAAMTATSDILKNLQEPSSKQADPFEKARKAALAAIDSDLDVVNNSLLNHYGAACALGTGGNGGSPPTGKSQFTNGAHGVDGTGGPEPVVQVLTFEGNPASLDTAIVLANPEQCQMLLNIADDLYMSGYASSATDVSKAQELYQRISQRLAFLDAVQTLLPSSGAGGSKTTGGGTNPTATTTRPLIQAYGRLEADRLTVSPLAQLNSIRSHADSCLRQIGQNLDLFAHAANWVPRLSYSTYQENIAAVSKQITALDTQLEKLVQSPDGSIDAAISNALAQKTTIKTAIGKLTAPNGILDTAAAQIETFTPMLKAKRTLVKQLVSGAEDAIRQSINLDPQIFVDSISSAAMGGGALNTVTQTLSAGYKITQTVQGLDSTTVKKDYLVSQFTEAGDSFDDFAMAYKSRMDGTLEVDDPGSAKILTTTEKLDKLLANFKSSIGESLTKTLETELEAYKNIIKLRNDAVISYNATINVLTRYEAKMKYYDSVVNDQGQLALQIRPDLPSLIYWLRRSINELRHHGLQYLNFGRKALEYWFLSTPTKLSLNELYPPATQLLEHSNNLNDSFVAALGDFAGNFGTDFPPDSERTAEGPSKDANQHLVFNNAQGISYSLLRHDPSALSTLKVRRTVPKNTTTKTTTTKDTTTKDSNSTDTGTDDGYYDTSFQILPATHDTSAKNSSFAAKCNVRVTQVRVWLLGASVDAGDDAKRHLSISIEHLGDESIVDQHNVLHSYNHDPISTSFEYDPTLATSLDTARNAHIFNFELFPGAFGEKSPVDKGNWMAPIGPFATWRLRVFEKDNLKLDLSQLTDVWIEFWGSNQSFKAI